MKGAEGGEVASLGESSRHASNVNVSQQTGFSKDIRTYQHHSILLQPGEEENEDGFPNERKIKTEEWQQQQQRHLFPTCPLSLLTTTTHRPPPSIAAPSLSPDDSNAVAAPLSPTFRSYSSTASPRGRSTSRSMCPSSAVLGLAHTFAQL